ncbi:hypothetical protein BVY01_02440, partial [bacterium I07]
MSYQNTNQYLYHHTNNWKFDYPSIPWAYGDLSTKMNQNSMGTDWYSLIAESKQPTVSMKKSIDNILYNFSSNSPTDPVDLIWHDKIKITQLKITSLIHALYLREKLKQENIYRIDQDICHMHT